MNKKLNQIKAVLFDFDGTLADTEKISAKIYPPIFKKYGFDLSYEQALELRSLGHKYRPALISKMLKTNFTDKEYKPIEKMFDDFFDEYIAKHGMTLKYGCKEILEYLNEKNVPLAIVTGTEQSRVEQQTEDLGIRKYFTKIFSVSNIENGKPAPDVYLCVCKQLNIKPEECIAVEDSPFGVMSACNAGCHTIMVPDLTQPTDELKNSYRFKTIKSLVDLKKIL